MKILVSRSDGGVSVMMCRGEITREMTELQIAKWQETFPEARVVSYALVPDNEPTPFDDEYRNAWTVMDGRIKHDMARSRAIHRELIRARRKPMLEALDVEFMRALEAGEKDPLDIRERKQRLRDATADPRIEAAQTIEELRAIDPLEDDDSR